MALAQLVLSSTSGLLGREFSATISGQSAGTTIEVVAGGRDGGTPDFATVNGRVFHPGLPYKVNTVVLREILPGTGARETRIDILADTTRVDTSRSLPTRPGTASRKVLVGLTDVTYVCSKADGSSGFVGYEFRRNNGLSAGSVGTPWAGTRRQKEFDLDDAFICNTVATTTSGAWTAATLNSTTNPHGYSGTPLNGITVNYRDNAAAYKEYTTFVDAAGKFNVLLQVRTGLPTPGATDVWIQDVSGLVLIASLSLNVGAVGLALFEFTHPTARNTSFTCRIRNNSGDGRLCIMGVNAVRLLNPEAAMPAGVTYDYSTFVRTNNYYSNNQGSQDYAWYLGASLVLSGSAHGGVTSNSLVGNLDGAVYTLGTNAAGTDLRFSQNNTVTDASISGTATVQSIHRFYLDGRCDETFNTVSASSFRNFCTGMSTSDAGFTQLLRPKPIANIADGKGDGENVGEYILPPEDTVLQVNPTTGQMIELYSSAPIVIPDFAALSVENDGVNGYVKPRFYAAKGASGAAQRAGGYSWRQITSLRRAA